MWLWDIEGALCNVTTLYHCRWFYWRDCRCRDSRGYSPIWLIPPPYDEHENPADYKPVYSKPPESPLSAEFGKAKLNPWASYQIRKIADCACRERFPRHWFQRKTLISDTGMHPGMCVTHVPQCVSGSLISSGGENVPGIPGACRSHNFLYLARGLYNFPLMASNTSNLPPTFILTLNWDAFGNEDVLFAQCLKTSRNEVTHIHKNRTWHGSINFLSPAWISPLVEEILQKISLFLKQWAIA